MILSVKVDNLSIIHQSAERKILHNVRFDLEDKSIYTIIGKNGSGKTTLIKAIGRLLDEKQYLVKGEILFENDNILRFSEPEMVKLRKNCIRYVFQDPLSSFDPLKKLKYYFNLLNSPEEEVQKMLDYFLLPHYNELSNIYPYEASAGMLQRVCFVIALLSKPKLLIFDEPTSSVDAPVINLFLLKLKEYLSDNHAGVLLITQDLNLARKISDKTGVLKEGSLCEPK